MEPTTHRMARDCWPTAVGASRGDGTGNGTSHQRPLLKHHRKTKNLQLTEEEAPALQKHKLPTTRFRMGGKEGSS